MIVDDVMQALVDQARATGHTWQEIGNVLHVSRQTAFQRFGSAEAAGDAREVAMTELPDAGGRAAHVLADAVNGCWEAVRESFDDRMLAAASTEVLADGWEQVVGPVGAFVTIGEPPVRSTAGYAVVDIPMELARGQMRGRVAFGAAGQISGFFVLDPDVL